MMIIDFDVIFSAVIAVLIASSLVTGISFLAEIRDIPKNAEDSEAEHTKGSLLMGASVCLILAAVSIIFAVIFAPYDLLLNNLLILLAFYVITRLTLKSVRRRVQSEPDEDDEA